MSAFGEWLLSILREILQFVIDIPLAIAGWLWAALLNLLSTTGIVGNLKSATALFQQIDPTVWFFLDIAQIPYGITAMLTAYSVRFIIRRLPFIG